MLVSGSYKFGIGAVINLGRARISCYNHQSCPLPEPAEMLVRLERFLLRRLIRTHKNLKTIGGCIY